MSERTYSDDARATSAPRSTDHEHTGETTMTPTEMTTIRNADALTLHATDTRIPREYRAAGTWLVIRPAWTDRGALQTYGVVSAHETRAQAWSACVNQCLAQQAHGGRATDRVAEVVA